MQVNIMQNSEDILTWDINKLRRLRDSLVKDGSISPDELKVIDCLLEDKQSVHDAMVEKPDFSKTYGDDVRTIHLDYFRYMDQIGEFATENYEKYVATLPAFKQIDLRHGEMVDILFDFFQELDKNWFNIFYKLYTDDNYIAFSELPSFSMYFTKPQAWICNVHGSDTIMECSDLAHEFGHGIQDVIAKQKTVYSPDTVLVEMFPMLMQRLFLDYLKKHGIEEEQCDLALMTTFNSIVNEASSLITKLEITALIPNMSNARNLKRVLSREFETPMTTEELSELFAISAKREIHYVLPYIVANNLYQVYLKDPELFVNQVNKLLNAKNNMVETAKELKLM